MIFVSILTISRHGMSKTLKQFTYLKRLTLELKVIHIFHMTLLISGCMPTIDSILVSILTFSCRGSQKTQNQPPDLDG